MSRYEQEMLMVCAVRYSMGRRTYMPSIVQRAVMKELGSISDNTLAVLKQDCTSQGERGMWGDEAIDRPGWEQFAAAVNAEIERRDEE